jgi:glycyl-tRNA synthetase
LLEHSFYTRPEDDQRAVFKFPPSIAPTKVLVVPLSNNPEFTPFVNQIVSKLRSLNISSKVDNSSGSIGRRYARNDEVGTPFGITIDFQTIKDGTVTLRERDSTLQVRSTIDDVIKSCTNVVEERQTWDEVVSKYGLFKSE